MPRLLSGQRPPWTCWQLSNNTQFMRSHPAPFPSPRPCQGMSTPPNAWPSSKRAVAAQRAQRSRSSSSASRASFPPSCSRSRWAGGACRCARCEQRPKAPSPAACCAGAALHPARPIGACLEPAYSSQPQPDPLASCTCTTSPQHLATPLCPASRSSGSGRHVGRAGAGDAPAGPSGAQGSRGADPWEGKGKGYKLNG